MPKMLQGLARFLRHTGANAAVEFAVLVPLLLLLISGTLDLGMGFQEKLKLQSALNTGMQHAMQTQGNAIATTKQVIAHGLGPSSPATLEASTFCSCASGPSCVKPCAPGLDRYATASVTLPYRTAIFEMELVLDAKFEIYVGKVK